MGIMRNSMGTSIISTTDDDAKAGQGWKPPYGTSGNGWDDAKDSAGPDGSQCVDEPTMIDAVLDSRRAVNAPSVPLMRGAGSFVLPDGVDRTLKGYAAAVSGSPFAGTKPGHVVSMADGDGFLDEQATGMVIGTIRRGARARVVTLDPLTGHVATHPVRGAGMDVRRTTLPVAVDEALRALRYIIIDASEDWNSAESGARTLNAAVRKAGNDPMEQRRLRRCARIIRAVARSPYMRGGPVESAVRDLIHADGRLTDDEFMDALTGAPAGHVTMADGSSISIAYTQEGTRPVATGRADDGDDADKGMDGTPGGTMPGMAAGAAGPDDSAEADPTDAAGTITLTIADVYVPAEDVDAATGIIKEPAFHTPTDVRLDNDQTVTEPGTTGGYAHVTRRITIGIPDQADINDGTIGRLHDSLDAYLNGVRMRADDKGKTQEP